MENHTIAFIGAGNMAYSLISGLIKDSFDPRNIWASDPDPARGAELTKEFGIHVTEDNISAARAADTLVLAVKPQILRPIAVDLAPICQENPKLVLSVAAGIRSGTLTQWLGETTPIVRAMPNTPALVQSGATALFATAAVSAKQRDLAETIMRSAGLTVWIKDEDDMDIVTALSGSGPAYYFLFMEVLENAAVDLGLDAETARLLSLQTAFGAARMALESSEDPAGLRRRVTSPGGTTEQALKIMEKAGIRTILHDALTAAKDRACQLDAELTRQDP